MRMRLGTMFALVAVCALQFALASFAAAQSAASAYTYGTRYDAAGRVVGGTEKHQLSSIDSRGVSAGKLGMRARTA